MIPDDPELRRALESRSGSMSPDYGARLGAALRAGRPRTNLVPIAAALVVIALCATTIGVVVYSRHQSRPTAVASGPRLSTPSPSDTPIQMPTTATVDAASSTVVWVVVNGDHLFRSTDRGESWERRPMPQSPGLSFSFIGPDEGWFLGEASPATRCAAETTPIWHTTDGGSSWRVLATTGIADAQCKESISFDDASHGFLSAWDDNHRPTIYRTDDGGLTWTASTLADPPGFVTQGGGFTLRAGPVRTFGDVSIVEALGRQASGDGFVYAFRSTDGGASWSPTELPSEYVYFVTATRWLQLDGQMHETLDGGKTWHSFTTDYSQAAGIGPEIVFADSNVGYATVRGTLKRTDDGGVHWSYIKTPGVVQPG